jgi:ATP-binding protein involved in chromosome partitioning
VPVLGVVENMSGFTDPDTGRRWELFGAGGGQRLADEIGAPLLGQVPLPPELAELADQGQPVIVAAPDSAAAAVLRDVADEVHQRLGARTFSLPILRG